MKKRIINRVYLAVITCISLIHFGCSSDEGCEVKDFEVTDQRTVNESNKSYLICGNGQLNATGNNNAFYMENGATLEVQGNVIDIQAKENAIITIKEGSTNVNIIANDGSDVTILTDDVDLIIKDNATVSVTGNGTDIRIGENGNVSVTGINNDVVHNASTDIDFTGQDNTSSILNAPVAIMYSGFLTGCCSN